jgi:prepilin-type N-terminal cleavage/methylation domain-containing protein
MNTKHFGFTLVELITVIILLGILSAVTLPRFFNNDTFSTFFDRSDFVSALSWARNRAVTSQCAHELRVSSTGWMVLRDDDRDGDSADNDCASTLPATGCASPDFFSFVYRNDNDIIEDGSGSRMSGTEITTANASTYQRFIFTGSGKLYRLTTLPTDTSLGCTALTNADLVGNNASIALQQLTLTADGMTGYVAVQ